MFSNGKFKNVIGQVTTREGCPVEPGFSLSRNYTLKLERSTTKNWIAVEDAPNGAKVDGNLSPTVFCTAPTTSSEDRNVFAIYVSYYVKVSFHLQFIRPSKFIFFRAFFYFWCTF